jgi:phage minor structural protein
MIPKLFASDATSFTSNGLGRLSDAIECTVTEERNGPYELYMSYPITGAHYADIAISRIIYAVPADGKTGQPFRIYRIEKPLNGIVSIYAEHISYQLNHIPVMPFTATSCAQALTGMVDHSAQYNPFVVWTDKTAVGNFSISEPRAFRSLLGGTQGSILDVYGKGEYEFDNYTVKLHVNRGIDTGVVLRYGKNITDLTQDENIETTITGICPFWKDMTTGVTVTLPEYAVWSSTADNYPYKRTAVVDFSADFQAEPTVEQLRTRANQYIEDNDIGIPKVSLKVEFVPLWQMDGVSTGNPTRTLMLPATVDGDTLLNLGGTISDNTVTLADAYWDVTFEDYKVLERLHLCDTLTVRYDTLGVDATAKIVKTVYNVLTDRYDSLEVGDARTNLASQIADVDTSLEKLRTQMEKERSAVEASIEHQTELITGGLGGYVVMHCNADGQPQEILIMDDPDMASAVNVIRMNKNGIGFSHTGYNGPFTSAWTIDGVFNADFITAGSLSANLIKAGVLSDINGYTTFNLSTGEIESSKIVLSADGIRFRIRNQYVWEAYLYDSYHGGRMRTESVYNSAALTYTFFNDTTAEAIISQVLDKTNDRFHDAVATNKTHFCRTVAVGVTGNISSQSGQSPTGLQFLEQFNANGYTFCACTNPGGGMRSTEFSMDFDLANGYGCRFGTTYNYISMGSAATQRGYSVANSHWTYNIKADADQFAVRTYNTQSNETTGYPLFNAKHTSSGNYAYVYNVQLAFASSSSKRYKHDIKPLSDEFDPHKLLELPVKQFMYNDDHELQYQDMRGKTIPGFIAEDVEEIYPAATIHDPETGEVESWDERRIIPGMLALIQEQQKRIDDLEARLARLEKLLDTDYK